MANSLWTALAVGLFLIARVGSAQDGGSLAEYEGKSLQLVQLTAHLPNNGEIRCTTQNIMSDPSPIFSGRFIQLKPSRVGYSPHFGTMSIFNTFPDNGFRPGCESFDSQYNALTIVGMNLAAGTVDFEVLGANFIRRKQKETSGGLSLLVDMVCPLDRAEIVNRARFHAICTIQPIEPVNPQNQDSGDGGNIWGFMYNLFSKQKEAGKEEKKAKAAPLPSPLELKNRGKSSEEVVTIYALGDDSASVPRVGWLDCQDRDQKFAVRYAILERPPKGGVAVCR